MRSMREKQTKEILRLEKLSVSYGPIHAVQNVDITVNQGEIVVLLGANGAGKTSTLKAISGIVPARGKILFNGKDIANRSAEDIANLGIIQSPEGRQLFTDLTVEENLRIGAFTVHKKADVMINMDRVYGYFPVLKERNKQIAGTLSGGEQQMLAIARALMGNPQVLVMDEPSLGLAPIIVSQIFSIIREIKESGKTILIVEQNALQTLKIADYGYVYELGRVIKEGQASVLIQDKELVEAYLGK
jgi:branched-chain amino acid transport system ATP-binding protein